MAQLESTKESPAVNASLQVSDIEQLNILYGVLSEFIDRRIDKDKCDPEKFDVYSAILTKQQEIAKRLLADISTVLFMHESLDDIREYMQDLYIKKVSPEEIRDDIAAKLKSFAGDKEMDS